MMTLLSPPPELDLTPTKAVAILHLDSSRVTNGLVGHVTLQVVERAREIAPHDFTSSIRQERNVPVGLFGQKENSRHFLAAIGELLRDFQQLSITMPMIVCCPSVERESEQGIDTRTLQKLTSLIEADHICFLHHGAQYTTDVINMLLQTKRTDATVWGLETLLNSRLPPTVSAGARRSRALQSYFHGGLASSNTLPLSSHRPYVISYDQGTTDHAPDVAGCFVFGDLPSNHPFMLSRILNGSMVAITNCKRRSSSEISIGEGDRIPYFASHDPSMLLQAGSIGFGLIRSIDHERGIMFIITPDDVAKQLEHVPAEDIILVHGVTDGAGWAYQEDLNGSLEPCYLSRARKGMQTVKSRRFKKKG